MKIIIVGIILIAVFFILLKNLNSKNAVSKAKESNFQIEDFQGSIEYFGYKSFWIAIKTESNKEVAEFIKHIESNSDKKIILEHLPPTISITSKMNDWIFVIGDFPDGCYKESYEKLTLFLEKLSERFGEVQFFASFRSVDYYCWARALNGKILRLYCYSLQSDLNFSIGEPFGVEKEYNLVYVFSEEAKNEGYFEREDIVNPDEKLVLKIAEDWSLNPANFTEDDWLKLWTNALIIRKKEEK